ncbi:hypothetical protein K493DRAFT_266757 [Basidiobolus meristosporus CBS 931.73]|uniref:Uncharacterized protein n=1 Tax=Basidiobolus meristosporus CBS 931.73 TaxID=1314790 RepID=A0A1Y1XV81_9FUNG|nr:hypothetical protein K493DRAFT_266757 [Basidiobolus meristosporus CBS 931.73]|eukprot:ORX89672.1 hypothetical protein K493DRAFT_266757 [Basidiobolus meristosporus CBS 931.73]
MNQDILAVMAKHLKNHELNDEEKRAIDMARSKVRTHVTLTSLAGAGLGYILAQRKRVPRVPAMLLCGGGFLIGGQVGMVTGTSAGLSILKQSPRLNQLVRDVYDDMLRQRGITRDGSRDPNSPLTPNEVPSTSNSRSNDDFKIESDSYAMSDNSRDPFDTRIPAAVSQEESQVPAPEHKESAWAKIRSANSPNSSWEKIRKEQSINRDSQPQRPQRDDDRQWEEPEAVERTAPGPSDFPRTREDVDALKQSGRARTNQYGDLVE